MFSRMTSPLFLTAQADRLMRQRLAAALKPLGIAPAQFMVLVDLAGGQMRTQAELAERLAVEQPTMANTLARMERDALIERTPKPGDRRTVLIRATAAAEATLAQATPAVQAITEAATRGLTAEERMRFLGTLAQVIGNLETT